MPELLEIVGQDAALAQLQRAAASDRRPHAYVFAGPEGVGRRTTAVAFGRLLLCESPAGVDSNGRLPELGDVPLRQGCGRCRSCRTASAGTNPDLHLVERQLARYHDEKEVRDRKMQELSIEVIRQFLILPAYRAPAGGRGKVFVVREANLMSRAAQNALLKTLEEPPPGVTIILIATSEGELLPTTRSRCQTVRFGPLPLDFVARRLVADGVAEAEASFWAALTEGSLGRASRLAGDELYEAKLNLLRQAAAPPAATGPLAELLTKTAETQGKRFTARDGDLAATVANRQAGQILLGLLAGLYRDALTVACSAQRPLVNAGQPDAVRAVAARFEPERLADILAQLARYEQLLWRNVNAKLLWQNVAITCASGAPLKV